MVRGWNPGGKRKFPHPSGHALGPTLPPVQWVSFLAVKRPGPGVNHTTPSIAEVKEIVELYFYSLSGSSWPFTGSTFLILQSKAQDGLNSLFFLM